MGSTDIECLITRRIRRGLLVTSALLVVAVTLTVSSVVIPAATNWLPTFAALGLMSATGLIYLNHKKGLASLVAECPQLVYWTHAAAPVTLDGELAEDCHSLRLHIRDGRVLDVDLPRPLMTTFFTWLRQNSPGMRIGHYDDVAIESPPICKQHPHAVDDVIAYLLRRFRRGVVLSALVASVLLLISVYSVVNGGVWAVPELLSGVIAHTLLTRYRTALSIILGLAKYPRLVYWIQTTSAAAPVGVGLARTYCPLVHIRVHLRNGSFVGFHLPPELETRFCNWMKEVNMGVIIGNYDLNSNAN